MIRMGFDASTTCIGFAIFNDLELVGYGKIKPTKASKDWRKRMENMLPQVIEILKEYKPKQIYIEDVPLMGRSRQTLVQLGAVQGVFIALTRLLKIPISFVAVSHWRSNLGLFNGTEERKKRANMKQATVEYVNKEFGLDLHYDITKPDSVNNDDDIADAIGVIYGELKPVEPITFGKKTKSKKK